MSITRHLFNARTITAAPRRDNFGDRFIFVSVGIHVTVLRRVREAFARFRCSFPFSVVFASVGRLFSIEKYFACRTTFYLTVCNRIWFNFFLDLRFLTRGKYYPRINIIRKYAYRCGNCSKGYPERGRRNNRKFDDVHLTKLDRYTYMLYTTLASLRKRYELKNIFKRPNGENCRGEILLRIVHFTRYPYAVT